MHRLLAPALSLALLAPAARADDPYRDRAERGADRRELRQDHRELGDDRHDLARIEALQARLEALRHGRPPRGAVAALDADVERELAAEQHEGRRELRHDTAEVHRDAAEVRSDRHEHDRRDDRRDLADDLRDRRVEASQLHRVKELRRAWAELRGRFGPAEMARRRALLADFVALARRELRDDRQELREDRRELREDRRETR